MLGVLLITWDDDLRQKQMAFKMSVWVPKIIMTSEEADAMTKSGTGLSGDLIESRLKLSEIITNIPKAKIRSGKLNSMSHRSFEPLPRTATQRL